MLNVEAMEILKVENVKFNATREIQWKFNLAIWSLIIAPIYFNNIQEKIIKHSCWFIILSIMVVAFHASFILLTQKSLGISKLVCRSIINQLDSQKDEIKIVIEEIDGQYKIEKDLKWIITQVAATAFLIITLLIVSLKLIVVQG